MKWPCKSLMLLLGAWLTVLAAGFGTARVRVFAAPGLPNCLDCQYCEEVDTYWDQPTISVSGTVMPNTTTPVADAYNCTLSGGTRDFYAMACNNAGTAADDDPPAQVQPANYNSATVSCAITAPPPAGAYVSDNGQGCKPIQNVTWDEQHCVNTD